MFNSAVRDAVAGDRCVPVDAMRVTFDTRSMCVRLGDSENGATSSVVTVFL
jgi:hypothetical protein